MVTGSSPVRGILFILRGILVARGILFILRGILFVLFVFFLLRLQPEAQREEAREPMTPWEHERGEREA